jgi:hypothetical protein
MAKDPRTGTFSPGTYAHINQVADPATKAALKQLTDQLILLRQSHEKQIGYVSKPLTVPLQANNNQLKGLQNPSHPQDAVTLGFLQTYVANYATAQGGPGTPAGGGGGGTGGGGGGGGTTVAPNYSSIVNQTFGDLGLTDASVGDPHALFKFAQTCVWRISQAQPAGETLVGLLTQGGGDGTFTCNGVTYACYRLCFDNGANVKILAGGYTGSPLRPDWTQQADIPVTDWHAPTDPATECP